MHPRYAAAVARRHSAYESPQEDDVLLLEDGTPLLLQDGTPLVLG